MQSLRNGNFHVCIAPWCFTATMILTAPLTFAQATNEQRAGNRSLSSTIDTEVKNVIAQQAAAWNRGSIDDFMQHYWKSDLLTFSSGGKTTRGWNATIEGYKRRYATAEQMGKVTFDQLEITPLGDSAALVLGRWRLERKSEPVGGNFSLIFRRLDNQWVIIHDHTSRDEKPAVGN